MVNWHKLLTTGCRAKLNLECPVKKSHFPLLVFIILTGAVALVLFGDSKNRQEQKDASPQPPATPAAVVFPIGLDNPYVRAAYARYIVTDNTDNHLT